MRHASLRSASTHTASVMLPSTLHSPPATRTQTVQPVRQAQHVHHHSRSEATTQEQALRVGREREVRNRCVRRHAPRLVVLRQHVVHTNRVVSEGDSNHRHTPDLNHRQRRVGRKENAAGKYGEGAQAEGQARVQRVVEGNETVILPNHCQESRGKVENSNHSPFGEYAAWRMWDWRDTNWWSESRWNCQRATPRSEPMAMT